MRIKESVTLDETIALLNEALRLDRDAVQALCEGRVKCNEALAEHPTIQVGARRHRDLRHGDVPTEGVGLLGLINGLFGTDERGWGGIVIVLENGKYKEFARSEDF